MESRLVKLEIRFSIAEDLLDTLNMTVFRQQEQIDQLQKQLRALMQLQLQAQDGSANEPRNLLDEVPPHY